MLQNLVTVETFGTRGRPIHEIDAVPLVTLPYGLGNGWSIGRAADATPGDTL